MKKLRSFNLSDGTVKGLEESVEMANRRVEILVKHMKEKCECDEITYPKYNKTTMLEYLIRKEATQINNAMNGRERKPLDFFLVYHFASIGALMSSKMIHLDDDKVLEAMTEANKEIIELEEK